VHGKRTYKLKNRVKEISADYWLLTVTPESTKLERKIIQQVLTDPTIEFISTMHEFVTLPS